MTTRPTDSDQSSLPDLLVATVEGYEPLRLLGSGGLIASLICILTP